VVLNVAAEGVVSLPAMTEGVVVSVLLSPYRSTLRKRDALGGSFEYLVNMLMEYRGNVEVVSGSPPVVYT
jgi:hypothetical protein